MTATSPGPWVPPDTFAHRLRALRHELGLTVDQIARECDVNAKTWSTWENGRKPQDMASVVQKIQAGTGVDRDWLLWGGTQNLKHLDPWLGVVPELGDQQLNIFEDYDPRRAELAAV